MVKGISFRWKEETIALMDKGAEQTGVSKTKFSSDAVKLLYEVISQERFRGLPLDDVISEVVSILSTNGKVEKTPHLASATNTARPPGYVIDVVCEYLKSRPDHLISTTQIASDLQIPRSTVRAYIHKLIDNNPGKFELIRGRPNQIRYIG